MATDLATVLRNVGSFDASNAPSRMPGSRGGPLAPLLEQLHIWLTDSQWNAPTLIDVDGVRRLADEAAELLLDRLIDWGGAGRADVAQDYAPAWSVLTAAERPSFREALGIDEAAWIRGRTFELEHAVGGVLYYVPKQHPLGDVMARTLSRILNDR